MAPSIAFIAGGRLLLKPSGEDARQVESAFANQALEREARSRELNAWRDRSGVWSSIGTAPPEWGLWQQQGEAAQPAFAFSSVTPGAGGDIFYALDMGAVGGLFRYNVSEDNELRLMHREGFVTRDIAWRAEGDLFAFSTARADGTTGISLAENEGRRIRHVSGGDSVDQAPSWVPGEGARFVYQSAAVGRNQQGLPVGLGPYCIELADADSEKIKVLASEEGHDLLAPKMLADGTLFFIRRPYKSRQDHPDFLTTLKDVVLFPFRLLRAIYYFFNFLSMMFAGKPLATHTGQQRSPDEQRFLTVWGHALDTRRAMQKAEKTGQPVALAPASWELVRRHPDGTETVIAGNVLCYDVWPEDGSVVYSDGSAINHVAADGTSTRLCEDRFIEQVTVISAQ